MFKPLKNTYNNVIQRFDNIYMIYNDYNSVKNATDTLIYTLLNIKNHINCMDNFKVKDLDKYRTTYSIKNTIGMFTPDSLIGLTHIKVMEDKKIGAITYTTDNELKPRFRTAKLLITKDQLYNKFISIKNNDLVMNVTPVQVRFLKYHNINCYFTTIDKLASLERELETKDTKEQFYYTVNKNKRGYKSVYKLLPCTTHYLIKNNNNKIVFKKKIKGFTVMKHPDFKKGSDKSIELALFLMNALDNRIFSYIDTMIFKLLKEFSIEDYTRIVREITGVDTDNIGFYNNQDQNNNQDQIKINKDNDNKDNNNNDEINDNNDNKIEFNNDNNKIEYNQININNDNNNNKINNKNDKPELNSRVLQFFGEYNENTLGYEEHLVKEIRSGTKIDDDNKDKDRDN